MQPFMTLFKGPNTWVHEHTIQHTFVPDDIKRQVMLAFAGAIGANQTTTPDLERALTAVLPVCTSSLYHSPRHLARTLLPREGQHTEQSRACGCAL